MKRHTDQAHLKLFYMIKNEKWIILGVYAFFLFLLSKIGSDPIQFYYMRDHPISNNWLWWPAIICFLLGMRGLRKKIRVDGRTYSGTHVTGYMDHGSFAGTDGVIGGVALSLAYISAFTIGAELTHERATFSSLQAIGAIAVLFIPFYLLLLFLLKARNKITWGICIGWLISVLILVYE